MTENFINGMLSPHAGRLTQLEELHMDVNNLTSLCPEVANWTRLRVITLSDNSLTGELLLSAVVGASLFPALLTFTHCAHCRHLHRGPGVERSDLREPEEQQGVGPEPAARLLAAPGAAVSGLQPAGRHPL